MNFDLIWTQIFLEFNFQIKSKMEIKFVMEIHFVNVIFRYVLATFIVGHVAATRIYPAYLGKPADFSLISYTLSTNWKYLFYPYYLLFGASGMYHAAYGLWRSAQLFKFQPPAIVSPYKPYFRIAIGLGAGLLLSSLLAFGGMYFPISRARFPEIEGDYLKLFNMVKSFFGFGGEL